MTTLPNHLAYLEAAYGSVMKACRATGIDPAYWHRLKHGIKTNPSQETLHKLGLREGPKLYEVVGANHD